MSSDEVNDRQHEQVVVDREGGCNSGSIGWTTKGSPSRRTAGGSGALRTAAIAVGVACVLVAASPAVVVGADFSCDAVGTETYVTVPACGTASATAAMENLGDGLAACVGAGSPIVLESSVALRCEAVVPAVGAPPFFALVVNGTSSAANRAAASDAFRGLFAAYTLSGAGSGVGASASVVLGGRLLLPASDCAEAASVLHDAAASVAGGALLAA